MSRFFYGGFVHPDAEVNFAGRSRIIQFAETGRPNIAQDDWSMKGRFVKQGATAAADIQTALAATINAYSVNGQTAGFLDANGNREIVLDSPSSIGGVVVTNQMSFGDLSGAERVTFLNYNFALQAMYFVSLPGDLLAYSEQVTFSDIFGGPLQVGRVPRSGLPIVQNISTNSFYFATQAGSLTCRTPLPVPEDPLWPEALMGEDGARSITRTSAKMIRGIPTEYTVSWSYRFRSIVPFTGNVHNRG